MVERINKAGGRGRGVVVTIDQIKLARRRKETRTVSPTPLSDPDQDQDLASGSLANSERTAKSLAERANETASTPAAAPVQAPRPAFRWPVPRSELRREFERTQRSQNPARKMRGFLRLIRRAAGLAGLELRYAKWLTACFAEWVGACGKRAKREDLALAVIGRLFHDSEKPPLGWRDIRRWLEDCPAWMERRRLKRLRAAEAPAEPVARETGLALLRGIRESLSSSKSAPAAGKVSADNGAERGEPSAASRKPP